MPKSKKTPSKFKQPEPIKHEAFGGTQVHINHYDEDGKFLFMTVESRNTKLEPPQGD